MSRCAALHLPNGMTDSVAPRPLNAAERRFRLASVQLKFLRKVVCACHVYEWMAQSLAPLRARTHWTTQAPRAPLYMSGQGRWQVRSTGDGGWLGQRPAKLRAINIGANSVDVLLESGSHAEDTSGMRRNNSNVLWPPRSMTGHRFRCSLAADRSAALVAVTI